MRGCVERFESRSKWRGMRNAAKLKRRVGIRKERKKRSRNDGQLLLVEQADGDGSGSKQTLQRVGVAVKGGDAG